LTDERGRESTLMVQHEIVFDPYFLHKMGWIKPKTFSRYCPFKEDPSGTPFLLSKISQ
jgi:hypothetical protein